MTPENPVAMNLSQAVYEHLLPKRQAHYQGRGREGKTRILDESVKDYGYERNYAIKLLEERGALSAGNQGRNPKAA